MSNLDKWLAKIKKENKEKEKTCEHKNIIYIHDDFIGSDGKLYWRYHYECAECGKNFPKKGETSVLSPWETHKTYGIDNE